MASSSSGGYDSRYDVFLSFRGDTRDSFTDHLYHALRRAALNPFRDDDSIPRGEDLKPEIERGIRQSRASIIVLSEKYATSRWCLDELCLILEQREERNHFVLPIFYHVDPSHVRKQDGPFKIEVKANTKWTEENVGRWKAALEKVGNMTGKEARGSETDLIAKIVRTIFSKLIPKLVSTQDHLTAIEKRAGVINSWLRNEQPNSNVLAICGMGGIGKTTLSRYIYDSNKQKYESGSFLEDIGKHCQQHLGLLGLQKRLLRKILGGNYDETSTEYTAMIEMALQRKRALIVLDDIDDHDQLDFLLGRKAFHTESKIIITTRHKDIDRHAAFTSRRCEVYQLELMNADDSLELLSWYAFESNIPMEGFKELAVKLAQYCEGNPLALKVLGSSLKVRAEDEQKRMIESWRSTLTSLNSLKGDNDSYIQRILRRSFDSLPHKSYKELFLHICFFFVGEYEDYVVTILEHGWAAKAGIMTLINRCLLTLTPSNKVMMHQLLQEMGRQIVREESEDPTKRSRVVQDDESYQVLDKGKGSKTVEGLALNILNLKKGMTSKQLALKTGSIAKMDKLKLLQLKHVELNGSYKNFPEIRWLCWYKSCLKKIPSGLVMSSLVAIDMTNGDLEVFESPVVLNQLKILNLKGCVNLVSVRNLHRLPKLETLILWACSKLASVCKTIGDLVSLDTLDLTGCNILCMDSWNKKLNLQESLKALCIGGKIPQQAMVSLPDSLKFFFLNSCNLKDNNEVPVASNGQPFYYMNLGNNLFECLKYDNDFQTLRILDVTSCQNLKSLLCLPSTLEELYTYLCYSLEKITFQSARFRLREFGYEGCNRLTEIQGLFSLVSVEKIDDADLGHMKWIKSCKHGAVKLVGDDIIKGRSGHMMLYEFGIMSTYLPGIIYQRMMPEYTSSSFIVPSCPKKRKIKGLNVTTLYKSTGEDIFALLAKVSNKTKGLTWIYNPVVYSKPKVDEDDVWLSYWPIGNFLDTGDEVNVDIIVGNGFSVSGCGATLVYMDGELCQENCKYMIKEEEVIGGDLSEFKLTKGTFYLCRRDFFKSMTPDWLKMLVGDTTDHCKELKGWKKSRQSHSKALYSEQKTFRGFRNQKFVLRIDLDGKNDCDTTKQRVMKAVSSMPDVSSIKWNLTDERIAMLTVTGDCTDPIDIISKTRKIARTELISVGPAKVWN